MKFKPGDEVVIRTNDPHWNGMRAIVTDPYDEHDGYLVKPDYGRASLKTWLTPCVERPGGGWNCFWWLDDDLELVVPAVTQQEIEEAIQSIASSVTRRA